MRPVWEGALEVTVRTLPDGAVQLDLSHLVERVLMRPDEAFDLARRLELAAKEAHSASTLPAARP